MRIKINEFIVNYFFYSVNTNLKSKREKPYCFPRGAVTDFNPLMMNLYLF